MNREEYQTELRAIKESFDLAKRNLIKKYAFANNKIQSGDIVEDRSGKIKVDQISVYMDLDYPQCVYSGIILTKKGEPTKLRDNMRSIYQESLLTPANH